MDELHFNDIDIFIIFRGTMIFKNAPDVASEIRDFHPTFSRKGYDTDHTFVFKMSGKYTGTIKQMKINYSEIAKKLLIKKFTLDFSIRSINISGLLKWKYPKRKHIMHVDGLGEPQKFLMCLQKIFEKSRLIKTGDEKKYVATCVKYILKHEDFAGNEINVLYPMCKDFDVIYDSVEINLSNCSEKNYCVNIYTP